MHQKDNIRQLLGCKTGGGQLAYLSDTKTIQFFEKVDQYGADLNCLKTIQAYS